ncbi:MAG: adenylate/guanylate cyclase domain-containing protein [Actinomycetota bacterium]
MEGAAGRYTREELVERSGSDPGFVGRLLELGLLMPAADGAFGKGDVQRLRLLEACDRAGMGAEAVAEAIGEGRLSLAFMDSPQYRWSVLKTETYGELATRLGVPFEVVCQTGAAMGYGRVAAEDRTREDDEVIFTLIGLVADVADPEALIRIGRVYVDGMRRVAEAENDLFQTYFVGGLMRAGMSYGEALEQASTVGAQMTPLMEQMVLTLYRRQQERGWTEGIVEGIERVIEDSGSYRRPTRPPAFAFVDLAGYTRITDEMGDETGARIAREMATIVERTVAEHEGTPVKWLGDGVMVHFRDPASAVRATLEMVAAAPDLGLPAHAGVAAGPVVMQDGDYFGRTVNLAARIAAGATAGQTLVSGLVAELAAAPGLSFREVGPVELKGFAEPITVFEATAAT